LHGVQARKKGFSAMQAITPELIRRFDVSGPRYTSYPTADRFVEAFGMDDYVRALEQRRQGPAALALARPLSIYVHLPFCESLCYYCACNKIITKHHERAAPYLALLRREVELHVQHMGRGAAVSQLHLGGGIGLVDRHRDQARPGDGHIEQRPLVGGVSHDAHALTGLEPHSHQAGGDPGDVIAEAAGRDLGPGMAQCRLALDDR